MNFDKPLNKIVVELLIKSNKKISLAESCTGGLVAKKITDVSGASECFECGFVTYSNLQKTVRLGVSEKTLEEFGAVSYQTAYEMSEGAKREAAADIGIGITGIAGPGGGTAEKPVGLVYIGICTDDVHAVLKLNLDGTREEVREKTSEYALEIAARYLTGKISVQNDDGFHKIMLDT